jgi:cytochrome c553
MMPITWWFLCGEAVSVPPPLASEMHARYGALTDARDAVIAGKLVEAKQALGPLTERDPLAPFPPEWEGWVVGVEGAARKAVASPDLASAASGVAYVAAACASCHAATGGGPALDKAADLPPQSWSEGQNMPLHQWATGWMWLGLLADNDDAWLRGAEELDSRPIDLRFDEARPRKGARELEQLVYLVANKALTTETPADRAVLYGNLIGVCAQCHLQKTQLK